MKRWPSKTITFVKHSCSTHLLCPPPPPPPSYSSTHLLHRPSPSSHFPPTLPFVFLRHGLMCLSRYLNFLCSGGCLERIFWALPPKCWDCRRVPGHLVVLVLEMTSGASQMPGWHSTSWAQPSLERYLLILNLWSGKQDFYILKILIQLTLQEMWLFFLHKSQQ